MVLNAELIEYIEATPDTIVALTTGNRYMVQEPVDTVVERVINYRKQIRGFTVWQRERKLDSGIGDVIGQIEAVRDMSDEILVPGDEESEETDDELEEGEGED